MVKNLLLVRLFIIIIIIVIISFIMISLINTVDIELIEQVQRCLTKRLLVKLHIRWTVKNVKLGKFAITLCTFRSHFVLQDYIWSCLRQRWWFLPRDAMLARYMLWPCVRLCLSVTSRCSTKTAKRRITQRKPYDSTGALVFWRQRSPRIRPGSLPTGTPNAGYISKTVQGRRIVSKAE